MIAVRRHAKLWVMCGAMIGIAPHAHAQRKEPPAGVSVVPMDSVVRADTLQFGPQANAKPKAPLSPKQAFLTSLFLPGYAQSRLDRPTASMLYAAFEVVCIGMIRKSAQDLNEAKRAPKDSILVSSAIDPNTGQVVTNTFVPSPFTPQKLAARRTHYEDWIAALLFNHLLSSADAYVAAYLWDFRANISVNPATQQAKIGARKSF